MTDDQQALKDSVKDTQESPMPSEEQKTEEAPTVEEDAPKEVSTQKTEGLPEDAKERTKREFDKLRKELRDERERREYVEKVFTSLQPKQSKAELKPLIDPETGLFNSQAQMERDRLLQEAQERAERAEKAVQQYTVEQENQKMYSVHPELDPESQQFDQDLHNVTSALLLKSMVNPEQFGGKQLSGVEAGEMAKRLMKKEVESAKEAGAKEALEQVTPKEQASLEASGSSGRRTQVAPKLDELRYKSRKGGEEGLEAIVARLRNVPDQS